MATLRTRLLLATLLAGGSTNCLIDTGPINMPPTVQIDDLNQSLNRDKPVIFTATIHDPDQSTDSLNVAWYVGANDNCNKAATTAPQNCNSQRNDLCSYTPTAPGPLCVIVQVTDRYGAKATASRVFTVQDQPPTAVISLISPAVIAGPLPPSSSLSFSAASSTDPDDPNGSLTFGWTVTQNGTSLSASTCPSPQTPAICSFTAATPGAYHVQLIATDPSQMKSAPISVDFVINEDQPPCIVGYSPASLQTMASAGEDNSFIVTSVADDLDPYPGSTGSTLGTFTWWYRVGTTGGFQREVPQVSNRLDVNADFFATGDLIQIRVAYQDRVSRPLSSCDQDAETCDLVPGCAQWVTWTVQFL